MRLDPPSREADEQRRRERLADRDRVACERRTGPEPRHPDGKKAHRAAEKNRGPDVNMDLARLTRPGPREPVTPPLNSKCPAASNSNACPEVSMLNRRASCPSMSAKTATPGIAAALFQSSVFVQSSTESRGLMNSTQAFARP